MRTWREGAVLKILKKFPCGGEETDRGLSRGWRPRSGGWRKQGETPNHARGMKLNSELRSMNHGGQKSTKQGVTVQRKDYEFM